MPASLNAKIERLNAACRRALALPPRVTLPAWADTYRRLPPEAGALSGRWITATVEVARGVMLAVTESGVHTITVMTCTQLLKTAFLENVFGYFAHLDPCPILLLQPKEEAAEEFAKERIAPLIRVTPVLKARVGRDASRRSQETLRHKTFPGGFLVLAGAGSPDNLARRPVRVILADEVDRYPAIKEGDPIALAEERTATFGVNWLSVRAGSPTVEDESRIAASYAESDQRRASVACPHCGHRQFLDFFRHVHWDKMTDAQGRTRVHRPETARIHCEACGAVWSEGERLRALLTVRWHQTRAFECCGVRHLPLEDYDRAWRAANGDGDAALAVVWDWSARDDHAVYRARCPQCGAWPVGNAHAGFHASKLYSPWSKDRPADIAAKWLAAQGDHERMQAWWNTQMGVAYRPRLGKLLEIDALAARGELWAGQVPDGVAVLTAGADVQDDRIEVELVGWGRNEESWSVDYHVIDGDFDEDATQALLDAYLKRTWYRADGRPFEVLAACVDSGGHHTQAVYGFCKARIGRRVWAIKGESARAGERNPVWPTKRPTTRTRKAYRPIILGVNAAKDAIRDRLAKAPPGPGTMHFPADRDLNYYAQLTAERLVLKESGGKRYRVWECPADKANESLDCRVYAYGALCGLMHFGLQLNRRADAVQAWTGPPPPPDHDADGTQPVEDVLPGAPMLPAPPVPPLPTKARRSLVHRLA